MSTADEAGQTWPDPSSFHPQAISAETRAANEAFRKATSGGPDWWKVGPAAHRAAAASGIGAFPRPAKSPRARTIPIDGKGTTQIALRVIAPERATGVHLFFHGGGMVFGSSEAQDPMLERIMASASRASRNSSKRTCRWESPGATRTSRRSMQT